MDYYAIDAVNWTSLKWMRESPLIYKHRLTAGREDTAALAMGRVTHTLVFEPEKFEREYAIWDQGDRRGNAWKTFVAEHPNQTIFKPSELDVAIAMADAVRRHPLIQPYLQDGEFEWIIRWTDPETGIACKARPDWILQKQRILLDLKTCVCAEGRRFGAAAARYAYHLQLAHYRNGCEHGLGWKPQRVLLVAVEKEAPHDVSIFEVGAEDLLIANDEVAELLRMVKVCRQTNSWPGRYLEEQKLQLPAYIYGDVEFEYE